MSPHPLLRERPARHARRDGACTLALQVVALALGRAWTPVIIAINLPIVSGMAVAFFSKIRVVNLVLLGFVVFVLTVNLTIP